MLSNFHSPGANLTDSDVLYALTAVHQFTLTHVSSLLNASSEHLRAVRSGADEATSEQQHRMRALLHFANTIKLRSPANFNPVGVWMHVPLIPGYQTTPADIYRAETEDRLVRVAVEDADPEPLLDDVVPGWRTRRIVGIPQPIDTALTIIAYPATSQAKPEPRR